MASKDFSKNEIDIIYSSTEIYDHLGPTIAAVVKQPSAAHGVTKLFQDFMQHGNNAAKLASDLVGQQILINKQMEDNILKFLNVDRDTLKDVINNSPFFKSIGHELKIIDQLTLLIPLIIASIEFRRINKQELSDLCYLLAHFKPYASRESYFFKYGVNLGQMRYTIEKQMSDRFDIKKLGTIMAVLRKRADSSYQNYIGSMKKTDPVTDKKLYDTAVSGVITYTNSFLNGVWTEYSKCAGKTLEFESSANAVLDKDTETDEFLDSNIQSDTAIKHDIIEKTLNRLASQPIDTKLLILACQTGFANSGQQYVQILRTIISETIDKMFEELPEFYSAIIGSFLFHVNPGTGKNYTLADFKTPVFLNDGIEILAGKKSHLSDVNMLKAREIFNKMINNYGMTFLKGETYNRNLKKALAAYWIFLVKNIKA